MIKKVTIRKFDHSMFYHARFCVGHFELGRSTHCSKPEEAIEVARMIQKYESEIWELRKINFKLENEIRKKHQGI